MSANLPAPDGLSNESILLWESVTSRWVLRPDELDVLADVCRVSDRIADLEDSLSFGVMTQGSMGQPVLHPAVAEIRQQQALKASLWRSLRLPDDVESGQREDEPSPGAAGRSASARKAAQSRWSVHHGAVA